eukprot:11713776-Alexandrium_andersonii.AAC.1
MLDCSLGCVFARVSDGLLARPLALLIACPLAFVLIRHLLALPCLLACLPLLMGMPAVLGVCTRARVSVRGHVCLHA